MALTSDPFGGGACAFGDANPIGAHFAVLR
jgi:hypothetical protein